MSADRDVPEPNAALPKLVVVEGKDDEAFVRGALEHLQIAGVDVVRCDGKDNMRKRLRTWRRLGKLEHVRRLVVIRDVDLDDSYSAALASCCDAVREAGFSRPHGEAQFTEGIPSAAVALFGVRPDSDGLLAPASGALEDLFLQCVAGDPMTIAARACADTSVACAEAAGLSFAKRPKTLVCAIRNLQPDWTLKPFHALKHVDVWNWSHPALKPYLDLLRAM